LIKWSTAVLPPIAKHSRCENLLNSHNQFLKIVHYVPLLTRDPVRSVPETGSLNMC
jgi:hypothetical protein